MIANFEPPSSFSVQSYKASIRAGIFDCADDDRHNLRLFRLAWRLKVLLEVTKSRYRRLPVCCNASFPFAQITSKRPGTKPGGNAIGFEGPKLWAVDNTGIPAEVASRGVILDSIFAMLL